MRILASFLLMNALGFAQNLTELGAVAAGSTVGGAGGRPVSNSISAIFGKVDHQTAKASGKESELKAAASNTDPSGVPPPPSATGKGNVRASVSVAQYVVPQGVARISSWADVAPALPPPPVMSPEDLHSVSTGMARADLLRLGAPSSKITTFEDGHVIEIYSYHQNGQRFGGVRLTDGVVSSVQ